MIKIRYDESIYSKYFYPHVSTFSRLLVNNRCCWCNENIIQVNRKPLCHHGAYLIPPRTKIRDLEFDMLGIYLFTVCEYPCHVELHSPNHWYCPIGVKKLYQHNRYEAFMRLCENWNSNVITKSYVRKTEDYSWLSLSNLT